MIEHPASDNFGLVVHFSLFAVYEGWLDQFEIPVAKLVENHVVNHIGHAVETELRERLVELFNSADNFTDDPAVDGKVSFRCAYAVRSADAVGLGKAGGVPQLGRKIAIPGNAAFVHFDVAALAFHGRHEETQCVRTILVNQAKRVDRVAF